MERSPLKDREKKRRVLLGKVNSQCRGGASYNRYTIKAAWCELKKGIIFFLRKVKGDGEAWSSQSLGDGRAFEIRSETGKREH